MKTNNLLLIKRIVGFSFIVAGLMLFMVLSPIAAQEGLCTVIVSTYLIVICVAVGSFLFLRAGFWNAIKSLIIVLALFLPWFAIFLTPLPSDIQLLLAVLVAFIAVLLYRRYYIKHSVFPKESEEGY